ncbi:MAG: V-type ATP synthase subunit I [Methanomicrobiales archaeon]|nr:V-type ATP synthase subunit I [Methanomicrobiales archaeon]
MLKPKSMTRLLIVASRDHLRPVVQQLYTHRVFHIQDFVEGREEEELTIGSPLQEAGAVSEKLVKIRSLETTFQVKAEDLHPKTKRAAAELKIAIDRDLTVLENEVDSTLSRISKTDGTLRETEQYMQELAPFARASLPMELYQGYKTIDVFAGRIDRDVNIPVPHEKIFAPSKEGNFIAVFVRKSDREQVQKILETHQYAPLPVPRGNGLPQKLLEEASAQREQLSKDIASLKQHLEQIREEQKEFVAACEELLTTEVEQAEAPLRFAFTDQAFLAEGWVPDEEVDRIKSGIALATGGKAFVRDLPTDKHSLPPVEYNNPDFSRPTQLLIDTYSRPRYDELDPTLFVALIFPIFFGIILGDVGYGLILLAISLILRRYVPAGDGRNLLEIMKYASISSIFFGFLFSEFLGFEIAFGNYVLHPILFARHLQIGGGEGGGPDITGLLIFAIWIGIVQITLGRILSSVNHYRHDGIRGAIGQIGWISAMWGILFLLWSIFPIPLMPDFTTLPALVAGLPITGVMGGILILFGMAAIVSESALELIEIPTIISHAMSYARLVAVGLSSVAIAMVVNFIAIGMLIEPNLKEISVIGILMIVIGVLVFIGGHLGNTALGMVGGGLQSLRLQYVEFFTKFYKGGGVKYNPFGMIKRFTED